MTSLEERERRQRRLRRNAAAKALREARYQQKIIKDKRPKKDILKLDAKSIEEYFEENE